MRGEKGTAQYRALTDALKDSPPPCRDDWRYVQDQHEIDADDLDAMGQVCRVCPVRDLCSAYARAAQPAAGMWAGRYWARTGQTTQQPQTRQKENDHG